MEAGDDDGDEPPREPRLGIAHHAPERLLGHAAAEHAEVDELVGLSPEELRGVIKDYDALLVRSATKVDAALIEAAENLKVIGRAGIANPWIFSGLDREQVQPEQVQKTLRQHLAKSIQFYGEEDGQRLFRKYAVQYLLLRSLDRDSRKEILKQRPTGEFLEILNQIYAVTA